MRFYGTAIVPGIAHGRLWSPPSGAAPHAGGMAAFARARERLIADAAALPGDLRAMYETLVFDPLWDATIAAHLGAGEPIAVALSRTAGSLAAEMDALPDPYLRARAADFTQIGAQLGRLLNDAPCAPPPGAIVVSHDMSAVELQHWASALSGVVLVGVPPTAHVTIVARSLGLPALALAAAPRNDQLDAEHSVLNAFEGWLDADAPPEIVHGFPAERVVATPDPAPVFAGGRRMRVGANVNVSDDAARAVALGADGIGLLRTEFFYLDRPAPPTLEDEREAYARIAAAVGERPIVVRTVDVGGDKTGAWFADDGLDHGMLGVRGIRLTQRHPDLFERHLQAILEGFAGSDLRIMFPMVSVPAEFIWAREAVVRVAQRAGDLPVPPLGIMLEVPAAAFALDAFARAGATFLSIGTNDLAQYFFASSRTSDVDTVEPVNDPAFRAFLRDAIAKAKAADLAISVCGEAAAAAELVSFWLASGVDELSVAPTLVPWLKARLRTANLQIA